ncbi:MAG: chromosome partitioning protein ParB [Acidimicrobiia bacterium]
MRRRGGLGKGIAALIPPSEEGGYLEEIAIDKVKPSPYQPRQNFDEEALNELSASIREVGLLQPVIVRRREDDFELIAGERRWRAARRAGLRKIPAIVRDVDDTDAVVHALTENLQREQLGPLEEASAYQQLIEDFNLTHDEISAKVGKSRPAISNALRLLQLPPAVQRLLAEGKITAGHARAILMVQDRLAQERLGVEIANAGLSVRQAEEKARRLAEAADGALREREACGRGRVKRKSSAKVPAAGLVEAERLLERALQTEVSVMPGARGGGTITIRFADVSDLERIVETVCKREE